MGRAQVLITQYELLGDGNATRYQFELKVLVVTGISHFLPTNAQEIHET
jgi:hypothetical protein